VWKEVRNCADYLAETARPLTLAGWASQTFAEDLLKKQFLEALVATYRFTGIGAFCHTRLNLAPDKPGQRHHDHFPHHTPPVLEGNTMSPVSNMTPQDRSGSGWISDSHLEGNLRHPVLSLGRRLLQDNKH
jgi:hypothetical protein